MDLIIILFGAAIGVGFFAIITFGVLIKYKQLLDETAALRLELDKAKTGQDEQTRKIVAAAQQEARHIIIQAQVKAQELIRASEIFSTEYKQQFQDNLLAFIADEKSQYGMIAQRIQEESGKVLQNVSQNIGIQIGAEMQNFHKIVISEMQKVQADLNKSIQEDYKGVKIEVENYKKQLLAHSAEAAFGLVQETAKKVLGRAITKEEHEKLVVKALQEAKAKNVF